MKISSLIVGTIAALVLCSIPSFRQTSATLSNVSTSTINNTLSGLSLTFLLRLANQTGFPIDKLDAFFAKILKSGIVDTSLVDGVYHTLGQIECNGFKNGTGLPLFPLLLGIYMGDWNGDLAGSYLCSKNCVGGTCAPYTNVPEAPISAYPFGCKCAGSSCDANGPVVQPFITGLEIRCVPNANCDCGQIYPGGSSTTGYICNWWNVDLKTDLMLQISYPPVYAPIRWCTCCSNQ